KFVLQRASVSAYDHIHAAPQVAIHHVRVSRDPGTPLRWIAPVEIADFARGRVAAADDGARIGAEETESERRTSSAARLHQREQLRGRRPVKEGPRALRQGPGTGIGLAAVPDGRPREVWGGGQPAVRGARGEARWTPGGHRLNQGPSR